ncbi:uncharacterized protein LOC143469873 isoform X2 [Clavelina lepadiformis]|uniref:uncharacterized protein LOC143469873 isoform X2 n=1 Tax=Clavelina lepadiformis TaxID=159417 RepID=UPI00404121A4
MTSNQTCTNLTKNVHELRRKLLRTEQTINDLEQLTHSQRDRNSSFEGVRSSSHHSHDEASSLPPPLTMEELMLESALNSVNTEYEFLAPRRLSTASSDHTGSRSRAVDNVPSRDVSHRSNTAKSCSLNALSEHTLDDSGANFYTLNINASNSSSRSDTLLSPRKKPPNQRSFSTPKKMPPPPSFVRSPNRPDSKQSYRQFESELRSSQERNPVAKESTSDSFRELEAMSRRSGSSSYSTTMVRNEFDVSLPLEVLEECMDRDDSKSSNSTRGGISPQRPISARSNATSVTLLATDVEVEEMKEKFSTVRSDNARLRTLVTQLRQQLAETEYSSMTVHPTVPEHLSEKIASLMDQLKANENTLRKTEDRLEYKENLSVKKDHIILGLKNKNSRLEAMLEVCHNEKTSAESAKEEAFNDIAELSRRLQETQTKMSTNLKDSKRDMNNQLEKLAEERAVIWNQFENKKQENFTLERKLRTLQQSLMAAESKCREQEIDGAKTMDQAQKQIRELLQEIETKHTNLKKCLSDMSLIKEQHRILKYQYDEMKEQNVCQRDRLAACQKENEATKAKMEILQSKLEMQKEETTNNLSATHKVLNDLTNQRNGITDPTPSVSKISPRKHNSTISELNMKISTKESHIKRLEARLSGYAADAEKMETLREELLAVSEKCRAGERRGNELEDVVHLMEEERTKYLKKVNDLEDQVQDKCKECESLEIRLKERTSSLSQHQAQMEELAKKVSNLESDKKQDKQTMNEMEAEISNQVGEIDVLKQKLSGSQAQVVERTRALDIATECTGKQESDSRRELKRLKKTHHEQCLDLTEQIEFLREECDKYKMEASTSKRHINELNNAMVATGNHIHDLETEIAFLKNEEITRAETHEQAIKILEEKSLSSAEQVNSLEGALAQCKDEISVYIEQLHGAHSDFQHQIAVKTDQVANLESELNLIRVSLKDEAKRAGELESALEERHKMLEDAASRISELEESQSSLQSQISKQEQQLSRENAKSDQVIKEMEEKLKVACLELDTKKHQFSHLNDLLKRVDKDFASCKSELAVLEKQTDDLRADVEVKGQELERSKFEWKEMKAKLDDKIELVATLEEKKQTLDRELKKQQEKCLNLETELTQLHAQAEDALQHNQELENYSRNRNADLVSRETTIGKLQEALRTSESARKKAEEDSKDFERSLEERQWQLQQRAAQLTQLDMQVQEFRNGTEKRNIELENLLDSTQIQLKERTQQVTLLDDQLTSIRDELKEQRRLLEDRTQNVRRLERDLQQREDRIEELTKSTDTERKAREERHKTCIETSQELRVAREREQNLARQLQESQREVARLMREHQQLFSDIDEVENVNREKDERLTRITKQLSSLASEKISVESDFREELDRMQNDVQKMRKDYQEEIEKLKTTNAELLIKSRVATGNQEFEINSALERERESREECKRAKETLLGLEHELLARKQVIEATNDTIIVKDAEIARLQAKISGLERGLAMTSLPNTPLKLQGIVNEGTGNDLTRPTPRHHDVLGSSPVHSKPDWVSDDNTTTSLFAGMESDVGSLAPSFVPIAASTKRQPEVVRRNDDDSSLFYTSSPAKRHDIINGELSADEDSFYKRVFADTFQNSLNPHAAPRNGSWSNDPLDGRGRERDNSLDSIVDMKPENCMANLQEKLRASEQRRRQVTNKLRHLKHTS